MQMTRLWVLYCRKGMLREKDKERERDTIFNDVLTLQNWCLTSSLEINVSKTKGFIKQNSKDLMQPMMINGQMVKIYR